MFAAANFHSIFAAALKGKDQAESSTQRNVQKNILLFFIKSIAEQKKCCTFAPAFGKEQTFKTAFW